MTFSSCSPIAGSPDDSLLSFPYFVDEHVTEALPRKPANGFTELYPFPHRRTMTAMAKRTPQFSPLAMRTCSAGAISS